MANLNPGGKTVEYQAPDFVFQNCHKIGKVMEILRGTVNRRRKMAFERAGNLENLIAVRVTHQQCCRAEYFSIQIGCQKSGRVCFKKNGMHRESGLPLRLRSLSDERDCGLFLPFCERRIV